MKSIKIKNLRSIKNSENIPLNALNILLGQNSSGKSTFLRLFPLLKQSIEARTRGPILWFGDYVDFGDFNIAVSKGEKEMSFEFEFEIPANRNQRRYYPGRIINLLEDTTFYLTLMMKSSGENKTYVSQLILAFFDQTTEISFDTNGKIINFLVNSEDFTNIVKNKEAILRNGIIPYLAVPLKERHSLKNEYDILEKIIQFLKQRLRANTKINTIESIIANTGIGSSTTVYNTIYKEANKYSKTQKCSKKCMSGL